MTRLTTCLLVAVLFAVAVLGVTGCAGEDPVEVPDAGSSAGATLVSQRCTMCHTLERVYAAKYDQAGWTRIVERMEKNGLVISGGDRQAVIEYLAEQDAD